MRLIGIEEILYFRAQDKYVDVVTREDRATIRTSLRELLAGLDPAEFWQVHRGVVVRVAAIDRIVKDELGKHRLRLKACGDQLPVSSAFLQRLRGM